MVVAAPVGLALLSEIAIVDVAQVAKQWWFFGLIAAGVVVLIFTLIMTAQQTHSTIMLWPLAALAVLVVAVASATQADVVIVMSLVALMGLTPVQERRPDPVDGAAGKGALLALGDSYMSGEGASVYYTGTDEADGNKCRQAPTAWAVLVSQSPQFGGIDMRACSGARTEHVRLTPPTKAANDGEVVDTDAPAAGPETEGELTQLQAYRADNTGTPAMAVVSLGGNDAGFSTIGIICVAPGDCAARDAAALWRPLDQVRDNLRATYDDIDRMFPQTPVVVVPYPDPISLDDGCDEVALSGQEISDLHDFVVGEDKLNGVIRATAGEFGFHVADMQDALADNDAQLCDPDGPPGLNFLGLRSVSGGVEARFNPMNWTHNSMHPNERGHAAMARAFQTWLAGELGSGKLLDARTVDAQTAATLRATRQIAQGGTVTQDQRLCELDEVKSSAICRSEGTEWALHQVGRMLLKGGLLAIAGTVTGAWAFAIGLFAWRRQAERKRRAEAAQGST
ncbi:GDSL-type esterase/lipase family protein [Actinoplanes sp. NPDC051633]|uniref:GDSL-type esterase/lipase family protein n=1 Tax=Actinoplanes sp. NPDC051633 TaxID=3155670 RepID=UPI0034296B8C